MKKILTLVIDGLGEREEEDGNAFKQANMPNYHKLLEEYPNCLLEASGTSLGLSEGQVANAMVSYKTIAAGQVLKQKSSYASEFTDIDSLATSSVIKNALEHVRKYGSTIHLMGLMSNGGISSNINDTINVIKYLQSQNVKMVVDFIADGKDVDPKSAITFINQINELNVPIATICGRYYAMDTENKPDRTKIYYDLIRNGIGLKVKELALALKNCYMRNITDEFLPPIIIEPDKNLKDNDCIFWLNYQEQENNRFLSALTNPEEFDLFDTKRLINVKTFLLFPMGSNINGTVLINEETDMSNSLGIYLNKLGLSEARISGPKNYELVTHYFNGEIKDKLTKCSNYLINSPEPNLDREEDYIAALTTKQIIKCMEKDVDFILGSLYSPIEAAKVGMDETIKSLEFIDECIGKILESAELNFYTIVLLSSCGNTEDMLKEESKIKTTNTTNKVPMIITDNKIKLTNGTLTGVAPTILSYMDISIPESMKDSKILIKQ